MGVWVVGVEVWEGTLGLSSGGGSGSACLSFHIYVYAYMCTLFIYMGRDRWGCVI